MSYFFLVCHCHICQIPAIAHFYATVYGDEEDARDVATATSDLETASKAPASRRYGEVSDPFLSMKF